MRETMTRRFLQLVAVVFLLVIPLAGARAQLPDEQLPAPPAPEAKEPGNTSSVLAGRNSPDVQMSAEQKKTFKEGLKLRKKYPLEVTVTNSQAVALGPQWIGNLGWCGGNLRWIFCASQPITVDGGRRIILDIQIAGERYIRASCPGGLFEKCANLATGIYPAHLGVRWDSPRRLNILANVGGKFQKLTFLLD